jgi:histidinol-phosphatase (PHP family)
MGILTDVHTHTTFSTDGQSDIFSMLAEARKRGLSYWGISEHFDYDYFVDGVLFSGMPPTFTDAERYFATARRLQEQAKDVHILVGGEFGFTRNAKVTRYYHSVIDRFSPDFVVNSVHTNGKFDYYESAAFDGKTKEENYTDYLRLVRASLDADYDYDIVGHIAYPIRWAPYARREMPYADYADQFDDILRIIIQKGKILEVNSSVKGLPSVCLPYRDVLERYFALGGRKVSFASDAHGVDRLAENRAQVVSLLKAIGFTYITVPCRRQEVQIDL